MFSIYGSLFNVKSSGLDWQNTIIHFSRFGDEVCLAVNRDKEDSIGIVEHFVGQNRLRNVKVISANVSFDNPFFDGKIKDVALKACTEEFAIQLDYDERLILKDRWKWENIATQLRPSLYDAVFVPVIDLMGQEGYCKGIEAKWYLHKNSSYLSRGPVNFGISNNGKLLLEKSDSCELIKSDGSLANSVYLINPSLSIEQKSATIKINDYPYVIHYGWLDKQSRLKRNREFWKPMRDNMTGESIDNIITTEKEFDKIPIFSHNLEIE